MRYMCPSRIGILVFAAFRRKGEAMMPHQQLPHSSSPSLSLLLGKRCATRHSIRRHKLFFLPTGICSSSRCNAYAMTPAREQWRRWQERQEREAADRERGRRGKLESIYGLAAFGEPFGFCMEFPALCSFALPFAHCMR